MCEFEVMLAHKWDEESDPTGYWVSEKLDGVRSIWTGKEFISRNGKRFHAPDYFKKSLPTNLVLDGELFGGRGEFQKTVGIVKSITTRKDEWEGLTFMVFDAPNVEGLFEERYDYLLKLQESWPKYLRVVEQTMCEGIKHLLTMLCKVESIGGEGLMLRQCCSLYENGRTKTLLKVKTFNDIDCIVIGYKMGKGRLEGIMGSLICTLKDDPKKKLSVGSGFNDEQRKSPPSIGSVITVKYQEMTKSGIPRFPVFVGERGD